VINYAELTSHHFFCTHLPLSAHSMASGGHRNFSKIKHRSGSHKYSMIIIDLTSMQVPEKGLHPRGWCGLAGKCRTRAESRDPKPPVIASNCEYHYAGLRYGSASTSTTSSSCTNLPIQCPLCRITFWKYNFIHHMSVYHVDRNQISPSIPPPLRLKIHISREEEDRMGVEITLTVRYREKNHIPNSDAVA
jgi:hypothetical protein